MTAQDRHDHVEYKSDIPWLAYWWVILKWEKNLLFRGLWQNTCQYGCQSEAIRGNIFATEHPSIMPSAVTQSSCWPLVNCKRNKNVAKCCQWASNVLHVLPANILPPVPKGLSWFSQNLPAAWKWYRYAVPARTYRHRKHALLRAFQCDLKGHTCRLFRLTEKSILRHLLVAAETTVGRWCQHDVGVAMETKRYVICGRNDSIVVRHPDIRAARSTAL